MKKWLLAAVAAVSLTGPASATVLTLENITTNGSHDFTFTYQGTLGPDEGVRSGDRLIIYDFLGYIPGSIFTPSADLVATTELVSPSGLVTPGFDDNPTLTNLVFTYVGPDFRNTGGPFSPFDFDGLGARSIYGGMSQDAFFTRSTKNNPDGVPGGSNTAVYTLGQVTVPFPAAVPEPATWAMMLGGFGVMGLSMRRRKRVLRVTA
ncbi:hypothetical protein SCH01S_01_00720 [Sphingomonas changbaiensis NBRC 104936]|uniref:Ice-binding protein C-terminal domain-containing protein n=1 Tax=Sphingomonas changbaiensis NBRC 104936 TaxID=1219043 RepID=A0A0E9MK52_9SPHN|nr:PEPxxWA-CTERM sorting domain-containing protein [Sphingomonas changbaiensis]GAO37909.1 hypothetical protein SCH01S_01_00720 [Sphingomonas changbaiensis NBRC 104936]